jgi:two-component system, LytTR family, response regulator
VRALIVDDELLARERIRSLLLDEPDVVVAAECANGNEAIEALRGGLADLAFLDVQMPGRNAFEVIREVGPERMPAVVFVTAYDRYAVKAFEVRAIDYLLKPFGDDRFRDALSRARARVGGQDTGRQLVPLLQEVARNGGAHVERLEVRSSWRISYVRVDDVDYAEAWGNYVRLHCGTERHLIRETMNGLEAKLDPRRFVRIHRSTLVNVDRVREIHPLFHGDWEVLLKSGGRLTMSRTHREGAQQVLAGRR